MNTTVTYRDSNGKKISKVFTSKEELIKQLSNEAQGLNLKRRSVKDPAEKLRLIRAEIGLITIIKHYSPETEDRKNKKHQFEIR